MCGRYILYDEQSPIIKQFINSAKEKMHPDIFKQISLYEVKPNELSFVAIHIPKDHKIVYKPMRWGYPYQKRIVINARCETCFDSNFFKDSYPAIVLASSYDEWNQQHQRYRFTIKDNPIYLAALAKYINNEWRFVILTQEAVNEQAKIHSRQPIIFPKDIAKKWCTCHTPTSLFCYSINERIISKC